MRNAARDAHEAELLANHDLDGDGEFSHAERGAALDARRAELEAALDVDGDGVVSEYERSGLEAVREARGGRDGERGGAEGDPRDGARDCVLDERRGSERLI